MVQALRRLADGRPERRLHHRRRDGGLRRGRAAKRQHAQGLDGQRVVILGGTGPVGRIAGVLAAQAGAEVFLSSRNGIDVAEEAAQRDRQALRRDAARRVGRRPRRGARLDRRGRRGAGLRGGRRAGGVGRTTCAFAKRLKVAADVNAVPPEGIAGVGVMDDAKPLAGTAAVGIGALAIGNVKYQTQHRLLVQMRERREGGGR